MESELSGTPTRPDRVPIPCAERVGLGLSDGVCNRA
jgi:hypothetical protein